MNEYEFYVLVYPNGKLVGIDHGSGGYPYECDIYNCNRFRNRKTAEDYRSSFNEFKVVKMTISVESFNDNWEAYIEPIISDKPYWYSFYSENKNAAKQLLYNYCMKKNAIFSQLRAKP